MALPTDEFPETLEKDILRQRDADLLRNMAEAKHRRLRYTGLAGIRAREIKLWAEHLSGACVVQRSFKIPDDNSIFRREIELELLPLFPGQVSVEFEDIWTFLESGLPSPLPDVVNLDFCGGFIYETTMDYPRQKAALQRLFQNQRERQNDFLLLFTLMPRDRGKEKYRDYLRNVCDALVQDYKDLGPSIVSSTDASFRFHSSNGLRLFKVCLPLLVMDIGRVNNYLVRVEYIRLYTKMIHIAFSASFVRGTLGVPYTASSVIKVLNADLMKLQPDGTVMRQSPPRVIYGH